MNTPNIVKQINVEGAKGQILDIFGKGEMNGQHGSAMRIDLSEMLGQGDMTLARVQAG